MARGSYWLESWKNKNGSRTYCVRGKDASGSYLPVAYSGNSKDDANDILNLKRVELRKKQYGLTFTDKLVSEAFQEFISRASIRPVSAQKYHDDLKAFVFDLRVKHCSDITKAKFNEWVGLAKTLSPNSLRTRLSSLRAFFNFLVDSKYMIEDANPMKNYKISKYERTATILTHEQFLLLLQSCSVPSLQWQKENEELKRIIICGRYAGFRVGDFERMDWKYYSNGSYNFKAHLQKGKKDVTVYLLKQVVEALGTPQAEGPMFPGWTAGRIKRAIYRKSKTLGFRVHFHQLRHSFGTWLHEQRVPVNNGMAMTRHSTLSAYNLYTHGSEDKVQRAMVNELSQSVPSDLSELFQRNGGENKAIVHHKTIANTTKQEMEIKVFSVDDSTSV